MGIVKNQRYLKKGELPRLYDSQLSFVSILKSNVVFKPKQNKITTKILC